MWAHGDAAEIAGAGLDIVHVDMDIPQQYFICERVNGGGKQLCSYEPKNLDLRRRTCARLCVSPAERIPPVVCPSHH